MMPSSERGMPHSAEMPGAAKALDSTSNPSFAFNRTMTATTIHIRTVIGLSLTISRGSLRAARLAIYSFLSKTLGILNRGFA
jgi:hypothetical protein